MRNSQKGRCPEEGRGDGRPPSLLPTLPSSADCLPGARRCLSFSREFLQVPLTASGGRDWNYFHFSAEETEVQRGDITCTQVSCTRDLNLSTVAPKLLLGPILGGTSGGSAAEGGSLRRRQAELAEGTTGKRMLIPGP